MKEIGTYILTHVKTGKFYVGSSQELGKRINRHYHELRSNCHHNSSLQNLWNESEELSLHIVPAETVEQARELEQHLIDVNLESDLLLNIGKGVSGGDNLSRNPKRLEIIERIVSSLEERIGGLTKLERKLIYGRCGTMNGMYGKKHGVETRLKMSEAHIGREYRSGFTLSEEQIAGMRERGKTWVGDKNPFFGKKHSEETKLKARERMLGKKPGNMRKISIAGVEYESLNEATRQTGVSPALIIYRIKSDKEKYSNYFYID